MRVRGVREFGWGRYLPWVLRTMRIAVCRCWRMRERSVLVRPELPVVAVDKYYQRNCSQQPAISLNRDPLTL